jgi:hypothetical protein
MNSRFGKWLAMVGFLAAGCSGAASSTTTGGTVDAPPENPGIEKHCEPSNVYGPKPCRGDDECREEHGEGWYCDEEHYYNDGCGGKNFWPICKRSE